MSALRSLILVLALACAVAIGGAIELRRWRTTPLLIEAPVELDLARGEGLRSFAEKLEERGVVDSSLRFYLVVRFGEGYSRFQAGHYRFVGNISPAMVIAQVRSGEVYRPIVFEITIPEGMTIKRLFARLEEIGYPGARKLLAHALSGEFAASLGVSSPSLEGFLFPATYAFTEIPSPDELLRTMVAEFRKRLPAGYEERAAERGLTLEQAVTFASLIELESAHDDERRMISEVIWNRLRRRMNLGIDAAIIYGIADYRGDLTFKHLRDGTNPYNTRLRPGLPPTPIGSPSLDALKAVLEPTDFGYLYYVAEPGGTGRHRFTKTLAEHVRGVAALRRDRRRR